MRFLLSDLSYSELVNHAKQANSDQSSFNIAQSAKKLYPQLYSRVDFFKKDLYTENSYIELIIMYNNHNLDSKIRNNAKRHAKKRPEYNEKHFSRKPRKRFSYNDYVVLYNSMMCKGKLNCSEHTKREWYKKQCKLHYADQYDELDFIRKTLDNRLIV